MSYRDQNTVKEYPIFYCGASCDIDNVMNSSSGGIFFELAKSILDEGGVVYGAVQETPLFVVHKRVEMHTELRLLRKSKYLRSSLPGVFEQVRTDLENGRKVLFSGVACQIAALYNFLNLDVTNQLYTCEVVCHGMPIRESWEKYIEEQQRRYKSKLSSLCFRDKREGWNNNCICELFENGYENVRLSLYHPVHSLYLKGINLEEGCSKCTFQNLPRIADITLADYWLANEKEMAKFMQSGISLISVNSYKGELLIHSIRNNVEIVNISTESALKSCRHMSHRPYSHPSRKAFSKMILKYSFSEIYNLFNSFGEIRLLDDLVIIHSCDSKKVIETFVKDTHMIVYLLNENDELIGICTFGDFVKKYSNGEAWINRNYFKVVYQEGCIKKIQDIFDKNDKVNRIPVVDINGKLLFEVRRDESANGENDPRKLLLVSAELQRRNRLGVFVHRPDYINGYTYSLRQQIRIKNEITFPLILSDSRGMLVEIRDIFKDEIGEKTDQEYIDYLDGISKIPPIISWDGKYIHQDYQSEFINVVNGRRIVAGKPANVFKKIHVYGRCGVFGYAVDDNNNIPSKLQMLIQKKYPNIGVENHGLWGADDGKIINNFFLELWDGEIQEDDIIVFYMMIPKELEVFAQNCKKLDTTEYFHRMFEKGLNFFDRPGHMNATGYKVIAKYIYEYLESMEGVNLEKKSNFQQEINCRKKRGQELVPEKIETYINNIKKMLPVDFINNRDSIGSIVMNCNPFTKGHRYLIEEALKQVDKLLIFVVEENKSYYPFELRIKMVREGTKDLDNVYVIPSGKFIISALTFPEYFVKEVRQDAIVIPTIDVDVFGKYIAPAFGITKRFVGTEPTDKITSQYNTVMRERLPRYGINLIEVERLTENDIPVSASIVRKKIKENDLNEIKSMLPESTFIAVSKIEIEGGTE